MFSHLFAAQAQGGGNQNSGGSGSGTSTGQDGYTITGNASPDDLNREYDYLREMPEGSEGVYWHVGGAATINGQPAADFPDGSLNANEHEILHIQWSEDSANVAMQANDGRPAFVLQLRRYNPETKTGEVLADLAIGNPFSSISNHIEFHGQVPDTQTKAWYGGPNQFLNLCPNVVDPGRGGILSEPYQFEFESNCVGENNSQNCRFKPSFIWTVKYFTASGHEYQQQWKDLTTGDFSKIRLYMYDRVPLLGTPTNQDATTAGGNNNFFPWVYSTCFTPPTNTAQPGELITNVRLECTGYTCGFSGWNDDDAVNIRYYGRGPGDIALLNGATQPLCRNQTYQLQAGATFDAPGYTWSASNGATITGAPSNQVTLNLTNVPATATSVTVNVRASNFSSVCGGGGYQIPTTITLNLAPGLPALQNIQLSNGTCATVGPNDLKVLTVDAPVGNNPVYRWELLNSAGTGPATNATFRNGMTSCPRCTASEAIRTPASGQFIATVSATTDSECGYVTALQAQPFTITSSTPTCPSGVDFPQGLCFGHSYPMVLQNIDPISFYSISILNVQPASGPNRAAINFVQDPAGGPFGNITLLSGAPTGFDVDVFVIGACPPITRVHCLQPTTPSNSNPYIHVPLGPNYCVDGPMRPSGPTQPPVILYPNPTTGKVEIQSSETTHYEWVKVTDSQGRTLLEQKATDGAGVKSFNLQQFPTGLYQVQLFDGKQLSTQRLVKE